ncbi:hypothetical protein RP20_CCG006206 [Aedes albopictus]|nr:hypothetical protein RP20_CCG006206 [Aedes albopictus]
MYAKIKSGRFSQLCIPSLGRSFKLQLRPYLNDESKIFNLTETIRTNVALYLG